MAIIIRNHLKARVHLRIPSLATPYIPTQRQKNQTEFQRLYPARLLVTGQRGIALIVEGDYKAGTVSSIGDGSSGLESSLLAGKVFNNQLALSSEEGYRYRNSGVDDEYFLNLTGHFLFTPALSSSLSYQWVNALGDLDLNDSEFRGNFTDLAEDSEIVNFQLAYRLPNRWNIGLNYAEVIDGRNTADNRISAVTIGYSL